VLSWGFPHILQKVSFSIFMLLFVSILKNNLIFMWFRIVAFVHFICLCSFNFCLSYLQPPPPGNKLMMMQLQLLWFPWLIR
jgi:hypothetical protein